MSNNTTLNSMSGGDVIQTIDNTAGAAAAKTPVTAVADSTGVNFMAVESDGSIDVNIISNSAIPLGSMSGTNGAANASVVLSNGGISLSTVAFVLTGTWAGTQVFEASADGTNYVSIQCAVPNTGALVTSTTANGTWVADVAAFMYFRVRCSVYTSGTASVNGVATGATGLVGLDQPLPAGSNTIGIVKAAGLGYTANPSAVGNGAQQNVMLDKVGRVVTIAGHVRDMVGTQSTTITSSTTTTTVVTAPGASVYADLTHLTITNGSGTATTVTLSDGTVSYWYNIPAGGGLTTNFNPPKKATTANAAWTLTCGTSVASIYCNIVYVKNL